MKLEQLSQGLKQAFFAEKHRIVFWYDPEQSFIEDFNLLELEEVSILNMTEQSVLDVKVKLELEEPDRKFLLYFPEPEPDITDDWLLDIKLYSRCFYADRFSIIFNELGFQQQSLRAHLAERDKFLASKARVSSLKRYIQPDFSERDLDMAMIACVLKAQSADLVHVILALSNELVEEDTGLESNPKSLKELEKYDLLVPLTEELKSSIGYPATVEELKGESTFKAGNFFIRLLTTGFCEGIGDIPDWAKGQVMTSGRSLATARALLSRWKDSSQYYQGFDTVSKWVEDALRIKDKIATLDVAQLVDAATFEAVEKKIIVDLTLSIPDATRHELDSCRTMILSRFDGYWASKLIDDPIRRKYRTIYRALLSAVELFDLRIHHNDGFNYGSCEEFYRAYESELYRFDMAYRHYCESSRQSNVEILKSLDSAIEKCYSNWYIENLAHSWGEKLENEKRLSKWHLPGISNQQNFFEHFVKPQYSRSAKRRVVVIISDAFRYEAAVELCERINDKRYSEATLTSQLGVVPSYTTLGMASLLPHKKLEYRETVSDDVFVDGLSTKGTLARNKLLSTYGGIAVTADTVKGWSREEGRQALKDQELVYVYHNVVDARGDSSSTESETFMGVEYAIEELNELTRKIMMHFNTSTILVTADHGFLFQQSKLIESDRTSVEEKPKNYLKYKKRYVIGSVLPDTKEAWKGTTKCTAGTLSDTHFWVPKGANRFHFVGGSRFVHGGAMPQEIVVPVITVKQLRGKSAEKRTKRKVGVISTKSTLKMVNNIQKFDLMQTEVVSDLITAVTVSAAIYDGENKVSSEEIVTFDCTTDSVRDRVKSVRLSLSGTDFNRKKDYFLIIKDKDLNTEMERYKVTIDLAFTDDFF